MNCPEMTDARDSRETTRELDDARAKYRGKIIPKPALRVMDAEMARLAASRPASRALKAGDSAPDFILPDAQGNPVHLYSLLREGHVVVVFYRGGSALFDRALWSLGPKTRVEARFGSSPEREGVRCAGGRFLLRGAGVVPPAWFPSSAWKGVLGRF